MDTQRLKDILETHQISIYFGSLVIAAFYTMIMPKTTGFEVAINPALAFMLFVTFLQVPLAKLGRVFSQIRFLSALLTTNFVLVPLLVAALIPFAPSDPIVRLGILLVLLTPCIDYVVTFSHLGRADARLLLAATPILLLVQILLLPFYLGLFLGDSAANFIFLEPFIHAFVWLIAIPLIIASLIQIWAARSRLGASSNKVMSLLPVPATALVLFVVTVTVLPQLDAASDFAIQIISIYVIFALASPLLGWFTGRLFQLPSSAGRTLAFSAGTRNSLVVLPLSLAIPGAMPLLPAIIVTQTFVELISELIYIRLIAKLKYKKQKSAQRRY